MLTSPLHHPHTTPRHTTMSYHLLLDMLLHALPVLLALPELLHHLREEALKLLQEDRVLGREVHPHPLSISAGGREGGGREGGERGGRREGGRREGEGGGREGGGRRREGREKIGREERGGGRREGGRREGGRRGGQGEGGREKERSKIERRVWYTTPCLVINFSSETGKPKTIHCEQYSCSQANSLRRNNRGREGDILSQGKEPMDLIESFTAEL